MSQKIKCSIILFTTAAIWGLAYVAQKKALGSVSPFTLNTIRGAFAWVFLIPCRSIIRLWEKKKGRITKANLKITVIGGTITGTILCIASMLQAYGLTKSEVGKAGFLTALYIIFVPFLSVFVGKKCELKAWISVLIALIGTYLMCVKGELSIEIQDTWLLLCAVFFAANIVVVSKVCTEVDFVTMSIVQFFVSSFLSLIPAILIEKPTLDAILNALPFIAYSGIFSCGIGYTIEIIGQEGLSPTVSSLILSFESVFSMLMAWLILGERMSERELIGCFVVVIAVVIAQLPSRNEFRRKHSETV